MKRERRQFKHSGKVVFEWEQSLEEVVMFINPPKGMKASFLDVVIKPNHLSVGIKGNPPFIDEPLWGTVVVDSSMWTLGMLFSLYLRKDDGVLEIIMQKASLGMVWDAVLQRQKALDPKSKQDDQKSILLERFQTEVTPNPVSHRQHPGFDFSNAKIDGSVPQPREFLGGMDRTKFS